MFTVWLLIYLHAGDPPKTLVYFSTEFECQAHVVSPHLECIGEDRLIGKDHVLRVPNYDTKKWF